MEKKQISERGKGILYIIGAAFFFALMNLFIRLSGDIPTAEKCFFRNAIAAVMAFILIKKEHGSCKPHNKTCLKYLFLRALLGTAGLVCNFYAVDRMNISDASALNKLSPFFAVLFSIFVLDETADVFEWLMTLAAFCGAMLVVKPGFSNHILPAAIGVAGGAAAGAAYTYVRKLGGLGENKLMIILFFSVFSCLAVTPVSLIYFVMPTGKQLLLLLLTGAAAMGGQFCISAAYTHAPAKELSVFDYSQVIFAAVLGRLFLGQSPDIISAAGYAVIIGAAAVRWRYSRKKDAKGV